MKQPLLLLLTLLAGILPCRALTLEEFQQADGRPSVYKVMYAQDIRSLLNQPTMPYFDILKQDIWHFPVNGTNIIADSETIYGLIENNFDRAYHNEEISKLTPLKRESKEWKESYDKKKARLSALHNKLLEAAIWIPVHENYIWQPQPTYDMETGSFSFEIPNTQVWVDDKDEKLAKYTEEDKKDNWSLKHIIHIKEDCYPYFYQYDQSEYDQYSLEQYMVTVVTRKFSMPIDNKSVALAIEENQRNFNDDMVTTTGRQFDFILKCRLVEDGKYSHLALQDLALVYNPTKEIVWTAKTGDHSNEMTAFK